MGFFSELSSLVREYFETRELTHQIIKRDYYFSLYFSGLYANFSRRYRVLSVIHQLTNVVCGMFHIYCTGYSVIATLDLNFTVSVFQFQLFTLMVFCVYVQVMFGVKRLQLSRLLERVDGSYTYGEEGETEMMASIKSESQKEFKFLLVFPAICVIIGINMTLVAPILDAKYGELGFNATEAGFFTGVPVPGIYPFTISQEDWYFYAFLLTGLQLQTLYFIVSLVSSGTFLFITMTIAVISHLKFLIVSIDNIKERAEVMYRQKFSQEIKRDGMAKYDDYNFQRCIEVSLRKNFVHHQIILRWFDLLHDSYSSILGFAYSMGTIVIAFSLISVRTGTSLPGTMLTALLICVFVTLIMGLISVQGQRIVDSSEELRFTMYSTQWYFTSRSIQQQICIFQEKTLQPTRMKGLGLVDCNMATFSNVMNSAYSYYNLMMAV